MALTGVIIPPKTPITCGDHLPWYTREDDSWCRWTFPSYHEWKPLLTVGKFLTCNYFMRPHTGWRRRGLATGKDRRSGNHPWCGHYSSSQWRVSLGWLQNVLERMGERRTHPMILVVLEGIFIPCNGIWKQGAMDQKFGVSACGKKTTLVFLIFSRSHQRPKDEGTTPWE